MRVASHPSYDRSISASTYESLLYSRERQLRMNKRMFIEAKKQFIMERRKLISERWASLPFYQEIAENFANELNANGLLTEGRKLTGTMLINEGFFDSLQATVGNGLGSIDNFLKKVGVRKEPEGYEETMQLFQQVVGKATDKKVSQFLEEMESEVEGLELDSGTKAGNTKFPYNKTANYFVNGIVQISCFYESVKKGVESGEMPEIVGNQFIRELRIAVEKYIKEVEREKGGMYTQVGSGDISAKDVKAGKPTKGPYEEAHKMGETDSKLSEAELSPEDLKKFEDKVQDPEYKATLDKITSLKGPAILAALGITTAAVGFLFGSSAFQDLVRQYFMKTVKYPDKIVETKDELYKNVEKVTKQEWFGQGEKGPFDAMVNAKENPLTGDLAEKLASGKQIPAGDYVKLMDNDVAKWMGSQPGYEGPRGGEALFKNWSEVKSALLKHPDKPYIEALNMEKLHDGFGGGWSQFKGAAAPSATFPQLIARSVTKKLIGTIVKKTVVAGGSAVALSGTGVTVLGAMTALSPILVSVGLTAVAAAGVWALWKTRIKQKSRLGVLTTLKQQLVDVKGPPVELKPEESPKDVEIGIILKDPKAGSQGPVGDALPKGLPSPKGEKEEKGTKKESKYSLLSLLFEETMVSIQGVKGKGIDDEGPATAPLPTVDSKKFPPRIDNPGDLPSWVSKEIEKKYDGLDFDKAKITVKDERTDKSVGDDDTGGEKPKPKPEPITPPVPVPKPTDNKSFAVAVFTGSKGIQVYRVLKKKTLSRYQSGAKSAKDKKSADIFKDMVGKYDASINALKAAGLIVNDKKIQTAIGNISTGKDGNKISFDYSRKGKNVKSKTGGFTQMKAAKTAEEIRNNILGADGKKVKDAGALSIVYLVSNNVVQSIAKSAKVGTEEARSIVAKVIKMWAKSKKAPKADKVPDTSDDVKNALRKNGLAESVTRNQVPTVIFDNRALLEALKDIREQKEIERWEILAGI